MQCTQATLNRREQVTEGHHLLVLECPEIAADAQAGQFVHVRVCPGTDPLLRRPFSIMLPNPKAGELQLLVESVGRGSEMLCQVEPGDVVDLLGPLGKPWPLPDEVGRKLEACATDDEGSRKLEACATDDEGFRKLEACATEGEAQRPVLVAGGIGVAPLIFLANTLQNMPGDCYVRGLFGARTEELLVCWLEFSTRCELFESATDDGSSGHHGPVTDLLTDQIARSDVDVVYACGPKAMLKATAAICQEAELPCYVSLEQWMGCGVGACMGCVVPTRSFRKLEACATNSGKRDGCATNSSRYKRVCKDGPVFEAQEIAWEEYGT